jgi:uncharacterized protein (DUF885 family)
MRSRLIAASLLAVGLACSRPAEPLPASTAASQGNTETRISAMADGFLQDYLERSPEAVTFYGIPGQRHDRLTDNSQQALARWRATEDRWQRDLATVQPPASGTPRGTYEIHREVIESAIGTRPCEFELWGVSQMQGWHTSYGYLVTIQPIGTPEARKDALARWTALPKYLDTEVTNLREGIRRGYTAPRRNVEIVIGEIRTLVETPIATHPFASPATRDTDPAFKEAFLTLVKDQILPAMRRYLGFLENEYLAAARTATAVSANPQGAQCYQASIRSWSSTRRTPKEVHDIGLREMEALLTEMKAIGLRLFGTDDIPTVMQRLRTDKQYLFKNRDDLLAYSRAALARARAAAPKAFNVMPKADVTIEPYPAFRERSAPGEYNPPSEDGTRPGLFYISAYDAAKKSRAEDESTAFHETIPGHHFQIALAVENKKVHPISRYFINSGFSEGWGLYAERLADEMGLFSSDVDRLGMLSSQAWRAGRLVVDTGLHALGWSREQAIDYLVKISPQSREAVAAEVDRYIIMPGQATAYMLGRIEIQVARDEAKQALGDRFDLKAFHDRVLEDGGVPLAYLREKVTAWSRGAAAR